MEIILSLLICHCSEDNICFCLNDYKFKKFNIFADNLPMSGITRLISKDWVRFPRHFHRVIISTENEKQNTKTDRSIIAHYTLGHVFLRSRPSVKNTKATLDGHVNPASRHWKSVYFGPTSLGCCHSLTDVCEDSLVSRSFSPNIFNTKLT